VQKNKAFPDLTGILLNQFFNLLLVELGKISSFHWLVLTNKFFTIFIEAADSDSAKFLLIGKRTGEIVGNSDEVKNKTRFKTIKR